MLVFERKRRKLVLGHGIVDWLTSAVNFLSANKDTISNVANVVGNVASAGAKTAVAVKDIYDVVKKRRATAGQGLPKNAQKALTQKSQQILKRLAEK